MKWLQKNPYFSLLGTTWTYSGNQKGRYLLIYTMFAGSNTFHGITPLLWGWFINELQKQGPNIIKSAWIYVLGYLTLHFLDWALHGKARVMERILAFDISKNYLEEMYHKTLHLPVKWHQDNHSGATINRVRKAYEAILNFFQNGFMYLSVIARFLFSFAAMLYFSPTFGSIAILFSVVIVWVILTFDKPFIVALNESNEKQHIVSSTLFDSLSNIITVITLRLQRSMEQGLMARVNDVFPPFKRKVVINEWKWFVVDTLVVGIYFTVMIGYVYQEFTPGETFYIGGLVALMTYVERFTGVFHDIAWQYTQIVQYHTDVSTAKNISEAYEEQHLSKLPPITKDEWKSIHLQNVSYEHQASSDEQQIQGLKNVSLAFQRGKKIAIIGESGSGKSTLLALIRGLYEPMDGGQIILDTEQAFPLKAISNLVTLFPQEPEIFENTIEYNITLGLPFDQNELNEVCRTVHFSSVIDQLPNGYQSNIREKGVNLSGGQKQRLALARGVLAAKQCPIILLDEPTSSVDPKTEVEIYDRLFEEFKDKVVISALHRLHLLVKFDYIYVMANGKVVDEGTFPALLEKSVVFQELWRHQEES